MKYLRKIFGSFSFRLYVVYFLMVGGAAWFIAARSLQAINVSVNQAAEEVMIDIANLLAEQVSQTLDNGTIDVSTFERQIPAYLQRRFDAMIYQRLKSRADLQLYITNAKGKVLYDSTNQSLGKDYSRWRDVKLTLAGQYGARVSPLDYAVTEAPDKEKAMFVAAPIMHNNAVIGVLTVVKANAYLGNYVIYSRQTIHFYAIVVFAISLLTGLFITWWLWRSIRKLSRYAKQLGQGNHVHQPKIIHSEFKPLANAMETMFKDLEGKEYVENYVHTMAHELKSPLSGMIATTELLQQKQLPDEVRQQFATNLHESATRLNQLIERLLQLAALENRQQLSDQSTINVLDCIHHAMAIHKHRIKEKSIQIQITIDKSLTIIGQTTLVTQSLSNLIDNAIDFSPPQSTITITAKTYEKTTTLMIIDAGTGIAEFAQKRLFERFFSTPRPDTKQRSSGLGLAFVKQVMTLHGGTVTLANHRDGGTIATLTFTQ